MIKQTIFWMCVFVMGFLEAIPVGATQLEIARRSLNGFLSSALMIIVGSVLSDAMYGVVAFWGVAPFLRDKTVIIIFWIFGAIVSAILGIWAIREGKGNQRPSERSIRLLQKHHVAFVTGFSLAIANPFMIAYWLIGAHVLTKFGLIQHYTTFDTVLFLIVGSMGIGSYLAVLATVVYRVKRFLSDLAIRRVTFTFGIILLVLASYFAVRAGSNLGSSDTKPLLFGLNTPKILRWTSTVEVPQSLTWANEQERPTRKRTSSLRAGSLQSAVYTGRQGGGQTEHSPGKLELNSEEFGSLT